MAHLDNVNSEMLKSLALQIGNAVSASSQDGSTALFATDAESNAGTGAVDFGLDAAPDASSPFTLGETLTVWKLKGAAFAAIANSTISGDVNDWVEPTSFLYHQLKWNSEPQGFARSSVSNSEATTTSTQKIALCQISTSPIASRLHQQFVKIDNNELAGFDDTVVRLLEIPPYHVTALWLFEEALGESRLIVISAPARQERLKPDAVLTSKEFFDGLASIGPIVGVGLKPRSL